MWPETRATAVCSHASRSRYSSTSWPSDSPSTPIEIRRRNFIGERTRTINELRVTSNGFLQCLQAVERASDWQHKFRRMPYGRGVGVAGSCYISGTNYPIYPNEMPQAAIQIQIERSGRVAVFTGASEIGQGSNSMVAYIAAEELGVPLDYVRVTPPTAISLPWISVRIRHAKRSWSATRASWPRANCARRSRHPSPPRGTHPLRASASPAAGRSTWMTPRAG